MKSHLAVLLVNGISASVRLKAYQMNIFRWFATANGVWSTGYLLFRTTTGYQAAHLGIRGRLPIRLIRPPLFCNVGFAPAWQ